MDIYTAGLVSTMRSRDSQDCPIATPVLNQAYEPMRGDIAK
jgi:hypothetical protein